MTVFDKYLAEDFAALRQRFERRLKRERQARRDAETIAEQGLRELYASQQQLMLLQSITESANSSSEFSAALNLALEQICTHMQWEFGNAYLIDGDGRAVACDTWFVANTDTLDAFVEASVEAEFDPGTGLPGQVLADGHAHWIEDLGESTIFTRQQAAKGCRLRSGCAYPIVVGTEVVAILEFFTRKQLQRDDRLVRLMQQIGVQLGRVVERHRAEALRHDVRHDALTGLPNRVLLAEEGNAAFARLPSQREGLALLVLDLDGFKAVNDRCGHHVGDQLLVAVARRLRRVMDDWESQLSEMGFRCRKLIARTGGDEFVVLIDGIHQKAAVAAVAGRLHRALETPFMIDNEALEVGVSIGIATSNSDYDDIGDVQRDADLAMYEAKAKGRGRTVVYSPDLGVTARKRRDMEQDLREAVLAHQIEPFYQAFHALDGETRPIGFEALARWRHPEKGLLNTAEWIEVAEETGLIVFIGDRILREACRDLSTLAARGHDAFVSVNIAPQQFLQRNFVDQLQVVLDETGVDPTRLRLEITESVAIIDLERTAKVLADIRATGVHTCLDDFGTGFASLNYLHELPLDSLKIDREIIHKLDDPKCRNIVDAVLDLSRKLGLQVIAEGIETTQQRLRLESLGLKVGQGYLFGQPAPAQEAFAVLVGSSEIGPGGPLRAKA